MVPVVRNHFSFMPLRDCLILRVSSWRQRYYDTATIPSTSGNRDDTKKFASQDKETRTEYDHTITKLSYSNMLVAHGRSRSVGPVIGRKFWHQMNLYTKMAAIMQNEEKSL